MLRLLAVRGLLPNLSSHTSTRSHKCRAPNWGSMQVGVTVYLEGTPEVLAARVLAEDGGASRPLLANAEGSDDGSGGDAAAASLEGTTAKLAGILKERDGLYRNADCVVGIAGDGELGASAPEVRLSSTALSCTEDLSVPKRSWGALRPSACGRYKKKLQSVSKQSWGALRSTRSPSTAVLWCASTAFVADGRCVGVCVTTETRRFSSARLAGGRRWTLCWWVWQQRHGVLQRRHLAASQPAEPAGRRADGEPGANVDRHENQAVRG